MRMLILVLLTVFLPVPVFGEPPKAVISGPTEAMPGDFIDISAEGSIGDFFEWKVEPTQFKDGRKSFRFPKGPDGAAPAPQKSKECGIASRPGKYSITLIVANDEGISTATWLVTVFDGPPQIVPPVQPPVQTPTQPPAQPPVQIPTQPPTQPPTDPPAPPDPIPNLTTWIRDQATSLVTGDNRHQVANLLAAGYRQNLAKIGPLVKDAAAFAKAQNFTNLGILTLSNATSNWDAFMKALADKLAAANLTRSQQDKVWLQIADGLEAVQ